MTHRVFVNYRTQDEASTAALVERDLAARFGQPAIFRASSSVQPGADFERALLRAASRCSVLIAVIGPRWLSITDEHGARLIDRPGDWTRREISAALARGIPVIPLLVDRTPRLTSADLPSDLRPLRTRQYLRLHHRTADTDLNRLAHVLLTLDPELNPHSDDGPPTTPQHRLPPAVWAERRIDISIRTTIFGPNPAAGTPSPSHWTHQHPPPGQRRRHWKDRRPRGACPPPRSHDHDRWPPH